MRVFYKTIYMTVTDVDSTTMSTSLAGLEADSGSNETYAALHLRDLIDAGVVQSGATVVIDRCDIGE